MLKDKYIIVAPDKDKPLARTISNNLNLQLGDIDIKKINGSEIIIELHTYIDNKNVFLLYNITQPVNESLMQIFNIADTLKKKGASKIHLIAPYLPYTKSPVNLDYISNINLVARFLEECKIDSIYTFDLYSYLISSAFKIPIYNISLVKLFSKILEDNFSRNKDLLVTTVDYELERKSRNVARFIDCEFINTNNLSKGQKHLFKIDKSVNNKEILIISNSIDTGKILISFANYLVLKGAKKVSIIATHGIFSEDAIDRIESSIISEIYVATAHKQKISPKIKVINKSKLLTEIIERTINKKNIVNFIK